MRRSDFFYELPEELIAQYPSERRTDSRLLVVDGKSGETDDRQFPDIVDLLEPNDLLVMNDTRVIPARLFGRKQTGGRVEIMLERLLDEHRCLALIRASKSPKPGALLVLDCGAAITVLGREDDLFELRLEAPLGPAPGAPRALIDVFEAHGSMPLPPYIERSTDAADLERYQTVYADKPGAVAAPTAGLHFDDALLDRLAAKGVDTAFVTLHVGAGTFQPVRVDDVREHQMHAEVVDVPTHVVEKIEQTRLRGGRVVAVGTTSVRSLESAAAQHGGELRAWRGESRLFIYPGYDFRVVDAMITNFHLPESTLLMLVCAFVGYDRMMAAYRHAVASGYRFFSYGDAQFLTRGQERQALTD